MTRNANQNVFLGGYVGLVCVSQRNFKQNIDSLPCGVKTYPKCEGGGGKETELEMKQSKLSTSTWQCLANPP